MTMANNFLLHGDAAPLPAATPLRAGSVSLTYCNGELRDLKIGPTVVVQRIYAAVRDQNWETVPGYISDEHVETHANRFNVSFRCTHRRDEIRFSWKGRISGSADGTVRFDFDGEAHMAFRKNRIGFCVLHPPACPDWSTAAEYLDGSRATAAFPRLITSVQPVPGFRDLRAIIHEVSPDLRVRIQFSGDSFETEDQRNWLDASFKTFCTPLRFRYPVSIAAGDRIHQSVSVRLETDTSVETGEPLDQITPVGIAATLGAVRPLPRLGLGLASHEQPLSVAEAKLVSVLCCAHLRADVFLAHPDWSDALHRAIAEASTLGLELELAVHVGNNAANLLTALTRQLLASRTRMARCLVFRAGCDCTDEGTLALVRAALAPLAAPIGAGTNADFFQFNAGAPAGGAADFLCWSAHPQAHAFDVWSLAENSTTFPAQLNSAQARFQGKPAVISPITFRPRFNPYASGPGAPTPAGELPSQVDPRQLSLFGAAWTLSVISHLARGHAASATLFETTGWRGVMETGAGSALPDKFPSRPGQVFPLYHVLADIGEFADGQLAFCESSDPCMVATLLLRRKQSVRLLVGNLTSASQVVHLAGLPPGEWTMRTLDVESAYSATSDPTTWRASPGDTLLHAKAPTKLKLAPFAYLNLSAE